MENKIKFSDASLYPVLALRGLPVFPYSVVHFDVGRDISLKAIETAMSRDKKILIFAQVDPDIEHPQEEDLYTTGTVCNIKQVLKISENNVRVLIEGISRAVLVDYVKSEPYFECMATEVVPCEEAYIEDDVVIEAYVREIKKVSGKMKQFLIPFLLSAILFVSVFAD